MMRGRPADSESAPAPAKWRQHSPDPRRHAGVRGQVEHVTQFVHRDPGLDELAPQLDQP